MVGVGLDVEGVVVAEDVLLDALVHVAGHGEEVLGVVLVLAHLLDPRPVAQQPLLVAQVALHHLLLLRRLLGQLLLQSSQALSSPLRTSRILPISPSSCSRPSSGSPPRSWLRFCMIVMIIGVLE